MEIRTARVQIPSLDILIDAYLAEPLPKGTFPGIIVFQEVYGVNDHIRQVTDRFAREGFVAIAISLFQRTALGFEVGYSESDLALGRKYKDLTTASELLADTQAAIAYLQGLPKVNRDRIGCIGFCFGGHVAYLAATLPEIKATASFYGAGIPIFTPGGGEPTLSRTPAIQGRIYLFWGTQDPLIPAEQAKAVEAALLEHHVDHRAFRYGAGHGFCCDHRSSYNADAAESAWAEVQQLFQDVLIQEPA